jgi:hypothetical protein
MSFIALTRTAHGSGMTCSGLSAACGIIHCRFLAECCRVAGHRQEGLWFLVEAHADLPGVVQSMQPKLGDVSRKALGIVASIAGAVLA